MKTFQVSERISVFEKRDNLHQQEQEDYPNQQQQQQQYAVRRQQQLSFLPRPTSKDYFASRWHKQQTRADPRACCSTTMMDLLCSFIDPRRFNRLAYCFFVVGFC